MRECPRHDATNLGVTSSYKLKVSLLSFPKETTEEVEAVTQSLEAGRIRYLWEPREVISLL